MQDGSDSAGRRRLEFDMETLRSLEPSADEQASVRGADGSIVGCNSWVCVTGHDLSPTRTHFPAEVYSTMNVRIEFDFGPDQILPRGGLGEDAGRGDAPRDSSDA